MKIDRTKIKRSTTEVPPDCKILIDKLKGCRMFSDILGILVPVESWTYGKSELYHWIDVLDLFDSVLQKATEKSQDNWTMHCDTAVFADLYECVIHILRFTTLLIEHSFSRHLYNSMEHLTALLTSCNLKLVLEVLQLLYMFSKRSNFLTRLPEDKREVLLERLTYLAESWGGKEAGFGLAACCQDLPLSAYPSTATSVHLEFLKTIPNNNETGSKNKLTDIITVVHMDEIHMQDKSIQIMLKELCTTNDIPPEKQVVLLTHIRLAYFFPYWSKRILCVQARLQALSVLVYANAIQDNIQQLLYSGLMEELVDILELEGTYLTDIKAAALRTLTSIIHLDRAQNFPNIIDATGAGSYHGFLPMMVRSCIAALTSPTNPKTAEQYPLPLATALFSFLYHLASYELGGEALVNCGMLESLLKVVNWNTTDVEHITFVTRAVRVIDLITNMDMQAFQAHNGLTAFINRLEMEVNACRKEQPFEIIPEISIGSRQNSNTGTSEGGSQPSERTGESSVDAPMDTDSNNENSANFSGSSNVLRSLDPHSGSAVNFIANGLTCLPQRAALLKSMLNFLKKVIQDPAFSDSIRHIMEGSLPASLKHLISNAEYYGASLFLLATDVVTVYVFQEPSLLSTLQDSGLTDVVSEALLVKDVPPTREVISSMPNVFSALCLNSRGLNAFVRCNPFQRLFKVLLSPEYLPAMRRRRTAEPMGDTASNLGNAMDELMRHQPSLKVDATTAIVQLLEELCAMGRDFRYSCWKPQAKPVVSAVNTNPRNGTSEGGSSEEEDDDDEEASTASHPQPVQHAVILGNENSNQANPSFISSCMGSSGEEKTPVPLVDYILNVMKFVDAILSNNSTDDHCREFVTQSGLAPLMTIFSLPNLPIDFPNSPACQAVSSVCKSILNLAHETKVLQEGMNNLEKILTKLEVLNKPIEDPGSSVLLRELANSTVPSEAVGNNAETPILHTMTAAHAYVMMFIHVCRTGQSDIRAMSISNWGSSQGLRVLQNLSQLYLNLVWESTVLLALCSGEFQPGPNEFGRMDLDNLIPPDVKLKETEVSIKASSETNSSPSSLSIPSQPSDSQLSLPADEPIDNSEQEGISVNSIRRVLEFPMEVDTDTSSSSVNPLLVHSSTQTQTRLERSANLTLQNYAKLIKPILSASSRLGRALAELFGLLVKLCVGSPLRQRRGHHMPTLPAFVTPGATNVAKVLAELLTSGLRWKPKPNSPVPRLTFSVCAVGFSAPLLFDEKKFPYHLMLKKFVDTEGLQALFEVFYWAMSKEASVPNEEDPTKDTLSDHQIEFLDSWLLLVEKFVSPKTVMESPHTLPAKISVGQRALILDTQSFLGHVHKMSFEAVMYLWKRIPMKNYGTRAVESMLAILCHILRYKEQKKTTPKPTDETPSTSRTYRELGRIGPVFIRVVADEPDITVTSDTLSPRPLRSFGSNSAQVDLPVVANNATRQVDLPAADPLDNASSIMDRLPALGAETTMEDLPTGLVRSLRSGPELAAALIRREFDEGLDLPNQNQRDSPEVTMPPERWSPDVRALLELGNRTSREGGQQPADPSTAPTETSNAEETSEEPTTAPAAAELSATETPSPRAPLRGEVVSAARHMGVNALNVQQLLDMGFPMERCIEALASTSNLLQATDFLLNSSSAEHVEPNAPAAAAQPPENPPVPTSSRTRLTGHAPGVVMEWDDNEEEQMLRAIAMSLGEPTVKLHTIPPGESQAPLEDHTMAKELLKPEEVDVFTETVLDQCLSIIDQLPESVFRVCELLVAVGQRNGVVWIRHTLYGIGKEIKESIAKMNRLGRRKNGLELLCDSPDALRVATRVHLFSLIFEELKEECAEVLEKYTIIKESQLLVTLFSEVATTNEAKNTNVVTPKWLAPLLLMIDLYEKAAVASGRRLVLSEETDHVWKWFDINSGKWCTYSTQNNLLIDKAFWEGESSIRITAGRRRYVINFNGMIQLNEETSNRRPITLWLKNTHADTPSTPPMASTDMDTNMEVNWMTSDSESEPVPSLLNTAQSGLFTAASVNGSEESKTVPPAPRAAKTDPPLQFKCRLFKGLCDNVMAELVIASVKLMAIPVEPETLHAVMRVCLRLTRHHEVAVIFAQNGGVHKLLTLNQGSGFAGFLPLANLLIRHVIEDPACLKYAIEKMMRAKALSTGASTCKELHYLLRVLAPVACRSPKLFVEVAKDILRVDMGFVTRRAEEDMRLIVKPVPCKPESLKTFMGECARSVIQQLLVALTLHHPSDDDANNAEKKAGATTSVTRQANTITQTPHQENADEQMDTDTKSQKEKDNKNEANELQKKKLLIPKYAICQLLAESVHSYSYSCKIIAEYCLQGGTSPYVPEDCTALAFLLDRMLPSNQYVGEKDCSAIVRDLVSAMAGCNHLPEAQAIVISEVKAALQRALAMRECSDKHARIQALAGLICTMIESCPSTPPTQMVSAVKSPQLCMNQAVRLLIRKSVVVDLARIPHNLDLSSTHMAGTVNAALKPLEVISRIVNQPVNVAIRTGGKPKNDPAQPESVNNTHTGGTSNSDGTHAQGEDTVEDADNTEHDISAAAESLLDATSESHTHEHEHNEERDDELEEIMDQLLDRDNTQEGDQILTDPLLETTGNRMDTEQEQSQRADRDFNNTTFEDEHDHNDTSESDSDASDGEEDGEEGNANDAGDDDDEDDDEDEDEEDDDEAGSNFDDRDPEMIEEGFIRFPGMDREEDMLMVQYGGDPENAPVFFTNNTSYNLNMGLFDDPLITEHSSGLRSTHPLLTPPMSDPPVTGTVTTRGHRTGRQRRYQYIQFNPRHPHPPAILQRLLGPSTAQEVIQLTTGQALNQGIRDARLLVMDASSDQTINRNGPAGTSGCLANYTALHWWCEEAKALDGESMHDCVVAIKREVVVTVELDRDKAFQARREKRLKEEEAKKKATSNKAAGTDSMPPNIEPDVVNQNVADSETKAEAPNVTTGETPNEPRASGEGAAENSLDSYLGAQPAANTETALELDEDKDSDEEMDLEANIDDVFDESMPTDRNSGERMRRYLFETDVDNDTSTPDVAAENAEGAVGGASDSNTEPAASEPRPAGAEAADPVPGPSGTQNNDEFKSILGDIDIPEGVDPSFLAALPEDMRQEVIAEHLRAQRLRQRSQSTTAQEIPPVNVVDVNPEFLAALPPNIQEEVLAQQRIEQQRRVATASNPNDPVDAEAFFRNLQPALRQVIMSDMEESQLAVLPPDLAAEAQNLRREWETRNRQLLQDRFFPHNHHASTTLSSILRNSGMRLSSRYALANVAQRAQWPNQWPRPAPAILPPASLLNCKFKGKQLVDHETLSCLLVLLFVDEPRLNTGRLHRVLRNLCYHSTTRQWVIKSLLSVMERANDCTLSNYQQQNAIDYTPNSHREVEPYHPTPDKKSHFQFQSPSWLNISLDAALGCRANVFQIQRTGSSSKKGGSENRHISIHAQAVPPICRHTLDVLSNLAKSFPTHFLPTKAKTSLLCMESGSKILNNEKETTPADAAKARNASVSSTGKSNKATEGPIEFWDLLLKLDTATSSRKGKSLAKVHSTANINSDQSTPNVSFDASPFGQLISMLAFPFVRRSSMLTDKLLRLLSLISLGIPDTSGYGRKVLLEEQDAPQDASTLISESHLRLIVKIITTKSCSEEGLEEATSLLLNLSYGPPSTRDRILSLLMEGVRELGNVVCGHIGGLMNELKAMNKDVNPDSRDGVDESQSFSDQDGTDKMFKGTLMDRFTKETVVITSGGKGKAPCELQLPSMAALTSKTSSQAFFLRLLKVIISLREAIRLAIKKHKVKGGPNFSSTMVGALADGSLVSTAAVGINDHTSLRLREVFQRVAQAELANMQREDQPMDVDIESSMDGNESRVASSNPSTGAETAAGTASSGADAQEQNKLSPGDTDTKESANKTVFDELKLLPRLSSVLDLDSLWDTLSKCLLELGHTPDHHAVLVLQPAVEAFFLVHASHLEREDKKTTGVRESREQQLAHLQQDLPPVSPITPVERPSVHQVDSEMVESHSNLSMLDSTLAAAVPLKPDTQKFLNFAETHRTVLNQILRQSTSHLADGPFAVLVDHTRVLDFDVKRRYFRTELERLDEGVRREDLAVHVRRSNVFEDSFREFHRRTAEEWKNRFYIVFEGEEGQDAGGLLREWYVIISREIFNPMYALFTISPGDRVTYMINPSSHCNSNHLFYFKFVGRVIAKAIYDNKLLECYFTRSFYKHILGKSVKYIDMESEDYSFYQGLVFLMDNHVSELGYDLTFSTEVQEFGVTEVRDLIPNGRNIGVTEENKMEYIRLVCQMKMTGAIRKQLNAFLEGFYDIIPKRLISIFNEQELELLLSGLPNIDIEDLKANTEYHKYQPNSLQIQWFWRALRSFDQADRAKFLQFVTGTSKVPLQGFGSLEGMNGVQKFQIHRDDRSTDRLPSAHTCFNQLDLPAYETYDKLRTYLLKAIHECSEGFGFA